MRFTNRQYDEAIAALEGAKSQLEPDGNSCAVCGDSGHMAMECGHNPLVAMWMCEQLTHKAYELHETLHQLAGFNFHMGVQLGPARVVLPAGEVEMIGTQDTIEGLSSLAGVSPTPEHIQEWKELSDR